MRHFDTDKIIERNYWKISEIVNKQWLEYFRELETRVIIDITNNQTDQNQIVSLGGWSLLRRENLWIIQITQWKIVVLMGGMDIIYERIRKDNRNHRPLVSNEEYLRQLMIERANHYGSFENKVFIDMKTPDDIEDEILALCSRPLLEPLFP